MQGAAQHASQLRDVPLTSGTRRLARPVRSCTRRETRDLVVATEAEATPALGSNSARSRRKKRSLQLERTTRTCSRVWGSEYDNMSPSRSCASGARLSVRRTESSITKRSHSTASPLHLANVPTCWRTRLPAPSFQLRRKRPRVPWHNPRRANQRPAPSAPDVAPADATCTSSFTAVATTRESGGASRRLNGGADGGLVDVCVRVCVLCMYAVTDWAQAGETERGIEGGSGESR
jgi:hypothetical protein